MSFQIGSVVVPMIAGFDIDQTYSPIGGETIIRTMSGRGIKQLTYHKLKVVTSGAGWIPAGLDSLDYSYSHILMCVVPCAVPASFDTRQATIPIKRRNDAGFLPFGIAIKADGSAVNTPAFVSGSDAMLAEVYGAVSYAVAYYPAITAWISRPTHSGSIADASYRWELVAEEV